MIGTAVHLLQSVACIWLAASVIYPVVNMRIMRAAQRNNPVTYYRTARIVSQPANLMQPALVVLGLTIMDVLLYIL